MPWFSDKDAFISLVDQIYAEYSSPDVQLNGGSVLIGSLSRREAASVKTLFLEKLSYLQDRKKLIIFSNHQMQYITSGFNTNEIFNMWSGNFSINELADWISYLDSKKPQSLPTDFLVTSITSPNNDNGNYMVGYSGNLLAYIPAKSGKKCSLPFINGKTLKQSFESCIPLENIKYYLDFKTILAKLKRHITDSHSIEVAFSPSLNQPFSIDKTGASLGAPNVGDRPLVFNEEGSDSGFDDLMLRKNDIKKISSAVLQIDKVAYKNGLKHVFVIPPVYESSASPRSNSPQNLIMDEALSLISKSAKATIVLDDRRNDEFLRKKYSSKYYYHYDHPSLVYGRSLLKRILKL